MSAQVGIDGIVFIASSETLTPQRILFSRAGSRWQPYEQPYEHLVPPGSTINKPAILCCQRCCPASRSALHLLSNQLTLPSILFSRQPPERRLTNNPCMPILSSHLSVSSPKHMLILVSCHGSPYSEEWMQKSYPAKS